jgi:crotonobetaine/carnitine-CoA ligase
MTLDMMGERTLTDLLEERAERYAAKTWLVCEDAAGGRSERSYADFLTDTRRLAGGLHAHGVRAGDKVALLLRNSPEFVLSYFALARLGAVIVPCDPRGHPAELAHLIGFSEAGVLVTSADLLPFAESALVDVPAAVRVVVAGAARTDEPRESGRFTRFERLAAHAPRLERAAVGSEDVTEILFTSGTTARPKGVLVTHANCLFAGEMVARSYLLDETDRLLTALPLFHLNAQVLSMLAALTVGGTLIVLEEYRATKFWRQVRAHRATHTSLVGMIVRTLLAQPPAATDRQHQIRRLSFALNVTDEQREEFERRFAVELINGYGLSEAVAGVSVCPVNGPKRWPSIGLPAMQREVRLVGEDGADVEPGQVGEVLVRGVPGRTLMKGYLKDPVATAAALAGGWLRTGDYARADEAGYLYFFDRKKDIIKRAGENISASEVEMVIASHPDVARVAVISVPDPIRDEAVMAVVEPVPGRELTDAQIIRHCHERMARHKAPTLIEFGPLPLTSVGKTDKKALRRAHAAGLERQS